MQNECQLRANSGHSVIHLIASSALALSELATVSDTLSSPSERGRTDAGLGL
jgi:hypothetical protein